MLPGLHVRPDGADGMKPHRHLRTEGGKQRAVERVPDGNALRQPLLFPQHVLHDADRLRRDAHLFPVIDHKAGDVPAFVRLPADQPTLGGLFGEARGDGGVDRLGGDLSDPRLGEKKQRLLHARVKKTDRGKNGHPEGEKAKQDQFPAGHPQPPGRPDRPNAPWANRKPGATEGDPPRSGSPQHGAARGNEPPGAGKPERPRGKPRPRRPSQRRHRPSPSAPHASPSPPTA